VHLVGFTIEIYCDARPNGRQSSKIFVCVISGFRRVVNGDFALLGCYAAFIGMWLPTLGTACRSHLHLFYPWRWDRQGVPKVDTHIPINVAWSEDLGLSSATKTPYPFGAHPAPVQWIPGLPSPGCEAAKIKNVRRLTATSQFAFLTWWGITVPSLHLVRWPVWHKRLQPNHFRKSYLTASCY